MIEIIIAILFLGLILMYIFDTERDGLVLFVIAMFAFFAASLVVGNNFPKTSKKKIEPKIKVTCENNKCDTTYIYE